jgi:hypothetical protein
VLLVFISSILKLDKNAFYVIGSRFYGQVINVDFWKVVLDLKKQKKN